MAVTDGGRRRRSAVDPSGATAAGSLSVHSLRSCLPCARSLPARARSPRSSRPALDRDARNRARHRRRHRHARLPRAARRARPAVRHRPQARAHPAGLDPGLRRSRSCSGSRTGSIVGKARIAFYRPGRQAVPLFELPFMRSVKGLSRGTLTSDSATVEVVPALSRGHAGHAAGHQGAGPRREPGAARAGARASWR